ncbi:alpha,alpha-trehalose phosphate synthase subunit [Metarhizium brunneum]
MGVLICSLFLPKSIQFNSPGIPDGKIITRLQSNRTIPPAEPPAPIRDSLTPPHIPTDNSTLPGPFANDDEFCTQPLYGLGLPKSARPRFNSASPAATFKQGSRLGHCGLEPPKMHTRYDNRGHVLDSTLWQVVDADQGNDGLRGAVKAAIRDKILPNCVWIGTLGIPIDALDGTKQKSDIEGTLANEYDMLTVFCSDKDFNCHYNHFCKQILWPVFHYQVPDSPKSKAYEDHSWKHYVHVNQAFAEKVVKNWKSGDTIWVHDYHLLLVPSMVRKKLPNAKIGFFLHVSFPSLEVFRCLAVRAELLEGILGANLVGFQIPEYTQHFLESCSRILGVSVTTEGIVMQDRLVHVINSSIGIDPISLNRNRCGQEALQWLNILRDRLKGKKLIVARDKLDQISGVRQKLLAYELFLKKNPEWRAQTVLVQVAQSSGHNLAFDANISDIATRINSSWAGLAYQPVVYLTQGINDPQYLMLLIIADALLIMSQREGMNLTSHEYIFCQDGKICPSRKHGSLILSEFTGRSSLFRKSALLVNPWDYIQCADAIKRALEMGENERRSRWENLYQLVTTHTGCDWVSGCLFRL